MPGMELSLSCVSFFALQNTGTSLPATVQVWLDSDGGAPTAPGVDLTELGSPAQYCSNAGTGIFQATFPEPVVIPADANFVVSLDFGPSTDGLRFDRHHGCTNRVRDLHLVGLLWFDHLRVLRQHRLPRY